MAITIDLVGGGYTRETLLMKVRELEALEREALYKLKPGVWFEPTQRSASIYLVCMLDGKTAHVAAFTKADGQFHSNQMWVDGQGDYVVVKSPLQPVRAVNKEFER